LIPVLLQILVEPNLKVQHHVYFLLELDVTDSSLKIRSLRTQKCHCLLLNKITLIKY